MGGEQLWILDDLWTQVGVLIENSASTSDLNWNQERNSVGRLALVTVLHIDVVMPLMSRVKRIVFLNYFCIV